MALTVRVWAVPSKATDVEKCNRSEFKIETRENLVFCFVFFLCVGVFFFRTKSTPKWPTNFNIFGKNDVEWFI